DCIAACDRARRTARPCKVARSAALYGAIWSRACAGPVFRKADSRLTLLRELVATSQRVTDTPGRLAKVATLAELLRRLAPEEIETAVACLCGETPHG